MQPRYFIALTLPDQLSQQIGQIQHDLFAPGQMMEPLPPHITLLHPNILMTLAPSFFVPKVTQIAKYHLPFKVELRTTAMFDRRVLHISVNCPALTKLHNDLVTLLPEQLRAQYLIGREFTAHVTLAQAKPKQVLNDSFIKTFKKRIDPLLPYQFTATNLAQFTWQKPRMYRLQII